MSEIAIDREADDAHPTRDKVIGAVEPKTVGDVANLLVAAGIPEDQIDLIAAVGLDELDTPINEDGLRGHVERFLLSLGEDLNAMQELRQAADSGQTLVGVPVDGDEAMYEVAAILRDHGAREVTHFGRWTITTLWRSVAPLAERNVRRQRDGSRRAACLAGDHATRHRASGHLAIRAVAIAPLPFPRQSEYDHDRGKPRPANSVRVAGMCQIGSSV